MEGTAGGWLAGAGIIAFVVLYLVVILGSLAMLVIAVVDIARRPDWQWKIAGQEKVLWLLLVILINLFAIPSLIYWFRIRPKLVAVEHAAAAGAYGAGQVTYAGWVPGPPPTGPFPVPAPAGWQPDPSGQHQFRWWDGTRWTEQTWSQAPSAPGPAL
jgi:Protein of unknown function (DUF2510)